MAVSAEHLSHSAKLRDSGYDDDGKDSDREVPPGEAAQPLEDNHPSESRTLANQPNRGDLSISSNVADAEDLIGISISNAQAYMKSPKTPAEEKARVLQFSDEYFGPSESLQEPFEDSSPEETPTDEQPTTNTLEATNVQESSSTGTPPVPVQQPRSDATRTTLQEGLHQLRRRSSSGSSVVAGTLKKFIPDLSSLLPFKSTPLNNFKPRPKSVACVDDLKRDASWSRGDPSASAPTPAPASFPSSPLRNNVSADPNGRQTQAGQERPFPPLSTSGLDGTASSTLSPVVEDRYRPMPLRRVTSENSLFLRPSMSLGRSSFDDTDKWDHVSEQVNSRFKALTDSFQDSNFRLPRLPNINFASLRPGPADRSDSDETRQNTRVNVARTQPDSSFERPPINPGGRPNSPDTTTPPHNHHRLHPIMNDALSKITGDIVVLGGYRGSILRSAKPPHRQVWIPVKVGLNLRKVDLEIGLNDEDEETMEQRIIPSGTLSHIGPVDICRRLLKHLNKSPNTRKGSLRVHDWGYDWRLSPDLSSRRLIQFLETLECNRPETSKQHHGAIVIAHSLGGLITRHAVNQRPELFSGVIYAGSPQHCVNILGPFRNGDDVLLSSRVLTAQVNFTLRTSFALLPENGRCFIDKVTGKRYDVDFFDPRTWDEHRLSPCISSPLPPILKEQRKSLGGIFSVSLSNLPLPNRRSSLFKDKDESESNVSHQSTGSTTTSEQSHVRPEGEVKQSLEPTLGSSSSHLPFFGPSVSTACSIPKEDAMEYLGRTLARTLAFKRALAFKPELEASNTYPPTGIIFGKTVPTVFGARVTSREAIKCTDAYDDLAFAAGDGVVLASAAQLPKGYRCVQNGWIESDRGHVGLLGDLEGVGKALAAIWKARQRGVGLGREARKHRRDII